MVTDATASSTHRSDISNVSRSQNPLSLAFLFYLVTLGAIISACLRPLSNNAGVTVQTLQTALGVLGVTGLLLGFLLGLFVFRRWLLALGGIFCGLCIGLLAGALTLISSENFFEVMLIAAAGGWLLIVAMCLAARFRVS
jgi:hypothetical protein